MFQVYRKVIQLYTHVYICTFFFFLILSIIVYSKILSVVLCACCLSVLCRVVCICSSHTPDLSLRRSFPCDSHKFVFYVCESVLQISSFIQFFRFLICVCVQSCLSLCDPMDGSPSGSPRNLPGKNTGVCCHSLLQGIFPTQGSNRRLLCLLHWQADSLSLGSPDSSYTWYRIIFVCLCLTYFT